MKIIFKGSFDRDLDKIRNKDLRKTLDNKILQILKAQNINQVTGLKKLKGYTHHYRIIVKTSTHTFRIGAQPYNLIFSLKQVSGIPDII